MRVPHLWMSLPTNAVSEDGRMKLKSTSSDMNRRDWGQGAPSGPSEAVSVGGAKSSFKKVMPAAGLVPCCM